MPAQLEVARKNFYESHFESPPIPFDTPFAPFEHGLDRSSQPDWLVSKGQLLTSHFGLATARMIWIDDLGMYIPHANSANLIRILAKDREFQLTTVAKPHSYNPHAPSLPPYHRPEVYLAIGQTPNLDFCCSLCWRNLELRSRGHPSPLSPNLLVFDLWETPSGTSRPYVNFDSFAPHPLGEIQRVLTRFEEAHPHLQAA